jgi:hypothetical protein
MSGVARAAIGSFACSALTWLGVLLNYTWTPAVLVWTIDLIALGFAVAALVVAGASLVADRRSALAWLALATSLVFPIWLGLLLHSLPSDAF